MEVDDGPAGAEQKPRPGGGVGVADPNSPWVQEWSATCRWGFDVLEGRTHQGSHRHTRYSSYLPYINGKQESMLDARSGAEVDGRLSKEGPRP